MINNILHSINFLPHVFLAEMSVGLMYSIVAFLGSLIIGIILERTLSTKYKETIDPRFIVLLGFFIAFTLVDGTWGLFFSEIIHNELGYKILTYGFHTMSAFSAFVWMGYMISYTKIHKVYAYLGNIYRFVALIVEMALLTANIWNGKVFTIIDFKKEMKDEKKISSKIEYLYKTGYDEALNDILTLTEENFLTQITNSISNYLEDIYSENCLSDSKLKNLMDINLSEVKQNYQKDYDIINKAWSNYTKNNNLVFAEII